MKIGMLTGLWYLAEGASLSASLERVARLGFRHVDLHGVFHAGPAHLTASEREAVQDQLERLGLAPRCYILHPRHNLASASDTDLEEDLGYLREGVDMAAAWGMNQLMLNAGRWSAEVPRSIAWSRAAAFIQRLCDYAAERGVYVAQETEPYVWFLVHDLESALQMQRGVDRPNFVNLVDLGHMGLAREAPDALGPLHERIIHAHFSDHLPEQHTNQVIGTGVTPTAAYLRALSGLGVDQAVERFGYRELVISLELGVPGATIDDPDGWVLRSLEHLQSIAPELTLR